MTSRRRPTVFDLEEVAFEEAPQDEPLADEPAADAAADAEPAAAPRAEETGRRRRRARAGEPAADPAAEPRVPATPPVTARRRALSWFAVFATGLSGLVALALSISLWVFIEDLFARVPALGGLAAILAALVVVGLLGMVLREWIALRRLREVETLRLRADEAVASDDAAAARAVCGELVDLYADRPATARGRKALRAHMREVIDGRDLVALAEREVLAPLDREAIAAIVGASRRVAAVTALSPRALVDLGYVIFASLSLVRRLATIYGGRPGTLGFLRVLRHAIAQLAVTGGMAAGDSLVGEVIGQGIAARLSAKLGEGVVNGLMTARLGLAALDVLRPLPFTGTRRPRVSDILSEIARIAPRDG